MEITIATIGDLDKFKELWSEFQNEQYKSGHSDLLPSGRNLDVFTSYFLNYVTGKLSGVCLLGANRNAVILWGDSGTAFEYKYGKVAQGWGTYVRSDHRQHGWSKALRAIASEILRGMGFDAVLGQAHNENNGGLDSGIKAGFNIYASVGIIKLRD